MKFLVVGSGGREHALAWKLGVEAADREVFVAPGNDGIEADPAIDGECLDIEAHQFEALAQFARGQDIDLTVVGPEAPLCDGIVDYFDELHLPIFGPSEAAARLEGSKSFAKDLMDEAGVPTADYEVFDELEPAIAHVESVDHPVAIKADGLAGGKGVVVSDDVEVSRETLVEYMEDQRFGEASRRVVIEEALKGKEMSFIVVSDGENVVPLATSRDHKRIGEGDTGPNTGGMGAVAPAPESNEAPDWEILEMVVKPTLTTLEERGISYQGFLYAGLMLTDDGPKVLEFNCRMGDPEAQPLVYALEADLGEALVDASRGNLSEETTLEAERHACCVVLASRGYPAPDRDTGYPITGLDDLDEVPETKAFHAGTRLEDGEFINAGGRVLGVTGRGNNGEEARRRAYEAVSKIDWEGMQYRGDIGE
ncbi:MAG: phosphoribosylamine--glycine ligase [Bradymonadaceae bacterium]